MGYWHQQSSLADTLYLGNIAENMMATLPECTKHEILGLENFLVAKICRTMNSLQNKGIVQQWHQAHTSGQQSSNSIGKHYKGITMPGHMLVAHRLCYPFKHTPLTCKYQSNFLHSLMAFTPYTFLLEKKLTISYISTQMHLTCNQISSL